MKRMNKKGFTLAEVLTVVAILAVLAGLGIPAVKKFIDYSHEKKLNNIAETIFYAAQNSFADRRDNGTLKELADFNLNVAGYPIKAGYLKDPHSTAGKLDPALADDDDADNKPFLYFMTLSKGSTPGDDTQLLKMLTPYISDASVLENSVSVEFNAITGNVKAVYYSEEFASLGYNNGGGENDLLVNRDSSPRLGYFGVDNTGKRGSDLPPLDVNIYDGEFLASDGASTVGIKHALCIEAIVSSKTDMYTIDIFDSNGQVITVGTKTVSLSFVPNEVPNGPFDPAQLYRDKESAKHVGGISDAFGNNHMVFKTPIVGSDHVKITWVLDYVDPGAGTQFDFSRSIKFLYPDIPMTEIRARLYKTQASATYVDSGLAHSYFASKYTASSETDSIYFIKNVRHLNNIRYTIGNAASSVTQFQQNADIDFDGIKNFAPISWVPTVDVDGTTTFNKAVPFGGTYSAIDSVNTGFKLMNLTMKGSSDDAVFGLFGAAQNATFKGVTVLGAKISGSGESRVGTIAGLATNTTFLQCVTYANVSISGGGTDAFAGGMVGELRAGAIYASYNGSYYPGELPVPANRIPEFAGSVNVSGNYSGDVCVGGLAGLSSGRIEDCYNNARVNIKEVNYSESGDDAYKSTEPVMTELTHTGDFKKLCIGGIAGRNTGTVKSVYNTNFVGAYKSSTGIKSMSGTVIGLNNGTCADSFARISNVPKAIGGGTTTGAKIVKESALIDAAAGLSTAFRTATPVSTDVWKLHLPENYRYPVLVKNAHITYLENIEPGAVIRELAEVDASRLTHFSQITYAVRVVSEDVFYEYNTDKMLVTFEWNPNLLSIDNTNRLLIGKNIVSVGSNKTVTIEIKPGADFIINFYKTSYTAVPDSTFKVEVSCFVAKPTDNPYQLDDYRLLEVIDVSTIN